MAKGNMAKEKCPSCGTELKVYPCDIVLDKGRHYKALLGCPNPQCPEDAIEFVIPDRGD